MRRSRQAIFRRSHGPTIPQPTPNRTIRPKLAHCSTPTAGRSAARRIRAKDGANRSSLLLVYGTGSDIARNLVVQLQQMWRAVGVEVQPKNYTYAQLYAVASTAASIASGKFDVGFYAWVSGRDPDDSSQFLQRPFRRTETTSRSTARRAWMLCSTRRSRPSMWPRASARTRRIQQLSSRRPAIFLFYPQAALRIRAAHSRILRPTVSAKRGMPTPGRSPHPRISKESSLTTTGTNKVPITVAYGDGIGPEIMDATLRIIQAAGAQIEIERHRDRRVGLQSRTRQRHRAAVVGVVAPHARCS